jgi:hypothetical protein
VVGRWSRSADRGGRENRPGATIELGAHWIALRVAPENEVGLTLREEHPSISVLKRASYATIY